VADGTTECLADTRLYRLHDLQASDYWYVTSPDKVDVAVALGYTSEGVEACLPDSRIGGKDLAAPRAVFGEVGHALVTSWAEAQEEVARLGYTEIQNLGGVHADPGLSERRSGPPGGAAHRVAGGPLWQIPLVPVLSRPGPGSARLPASGSR
jgi:hypothetical protein